MQNIDTLTLVRSLKRMARLTSTGARQRVSEFLMSAIEKELTLRAQRATLAVNATTVV
jgi:hypothetical protein